MGKHNGSFGKQYGRVVGKDADERPGWTGPGSAKKTESTKKEKAKRTPKIEEKKDEAVVMEALVSIKLQQALLNIFRDTLPEILTSDCLQPLLQDVKSALYERDFGRAFGKEEYLEAYSVRWSPSRALCYVSILAQLQEELAEIFTFETGLAPRGEAAPDRPPIMKAVCFGGGAAEVVAFAGFLRFLQGPTSSIPAAPAEALDELSLVEKKASMEITLVDSARWQNVVLKLEGGLTSLPTLPKYSNAAARAANSSLLKAGALGVGFEQEDVLALNQSQISRIVERGNLLTLLFTLNELYTCSMTKATTFLLNLTMATKSGTLLLVVDSPGSYSEITVGSESKKYPMHILLDHTLGSKKVGEQVVQTSWEKLVSKDAQWFRLPAELQYSIPLENMRYQIHLYRRI